jgi:hypothetical protein
MSNIVEKIIYGLFFVQLIRWIATIIYYTFYMNYLEKYVRSINVNICDNILWIAPLVYFSGGLK